MTEKIIEGLQIIVTQLDQQSDGHLIQSRIFASQGLTKLAEKYAEHAEEERGYVIKCIDRIIDLGGEVKLEDKKSAPVCKDAEEFLKYDLQVKRRLEMACRPCKTRAGRFNHFCNFERILQRRRKRYV